jgi:hypothetical protein
MFSSVLRSSLIQTSAPIGAKQSVESTTEICFRGKYSMAFGTPTLRLAATQDIFADTSGTHLDKKMYEKYFQNFI